MFSHARLDPDRQASRRLHLTTFLPGRADYPSQKLLHPRINQHLALQEVTLAEVLKAAGYRCAHLGKWHLGGKGFGPLDHGFDVSVGDDKEYLTDRLTDEAERFIEANRDRPFFLYLCHFAVHIPLAGKPDLVKKYEAKANPRQGLGQGQNNPQYAAMVEGVDESVGRIVKKLEELKLSEDTLIVFTSDNGGLAVKEGPMTPATSNAPLRGAKGQLFEGGIRVPLIACKPGTIPAARVCEVPVTSTDYFPTFLHLAGVERTGGASEDGVDITPLLTAAGEPPRRDTLYWHLPHYSNQGGTPTGAVHRGNFKLIEFYEDGRLELYNLADDAGENRDLSREMPDQRNQLHRLLADWPARWTRRCRRRIPITIPTGSRRRRGPRPGRPRLAAGLARPSIPSHLPIDQPPDLPRVAVAQLRRQGRLGKVLVTHRPHEPLQRGRADRCGSRRHRRRIRPAVVHRVARLNPRRETVEDQRGRPSLEHGNQVPVLLQVLRRAVDRGGELPVQRARPAPSLLLTCPSPRAWRGRTPPRAARGC